MLAKIFLVLLLNVAAVLEHHFAEILRRERGEHRPAVSLLPEERDAPRVIHVRMTEDDRINLLRRIERKLRVLHRRLLAMPLEETAVEEDPFPIRLNFVTGTRDLPGSPVGNDFHRPPGKEKSGKRPLVAPSRRRGAKWGRAAPWQMIFMNEGKRMCVSEQILLFIVPQIVTAVPFTFRIAKRINIIEY